MSKQIAFSKSLPLPAMVTREVAVGLLHDHGEMIKLNPQVTNYRSIQAPRDVGSNEVSTHIWYDLSEDISHLSMGTARAIATYKVCYRDLENGVDFHIYGPQGLDVKERWIIANTTEPGDLGGCLLLRRDCNISSISVMSPVTEKNLYRAHQLFEERAIDKCLPPRHPSRPRLPFSRSSSLGFSRSGSRSDKRSSMISVLDPEDTHPAFRDSVDWSLVSDSIGTRTSSLRSRSSKSRTSSLRNIPNIQTAHPQPSNRSPSRLSYAGSSRASSYSKRRDSMSTQYSNGTSLPSSPTPSEISQAFNSKSFPTAYTKLGGNPFIAKSTASVSSNSTPSLTDESSDDETTTSTEELQTPVDSADAAQIFEAMQRRHFATMSASSPPPPPIPERSQSRVLPRPLSVRTQSVTAFYEGNTMFPFGDLPDRASSMQCCSSRRRPGKPMGWANPQDDLCTEETEKMLDLATGNRFSIYG